MRTRHLLVVALTTLLAWASACGEMEPLDPQPLATLQGRITNAGNITATNPRVALLWFKEVSGSGDYKVAQDIPMTTQFPASFSLQLLAPPPAEVMTSRSEMKPSDQQDWGPNDGAFALGTPVVYDDVNGNGKLDLLDDTAVSPVDKILGANQELMVFYFEGGLPQAFLAPDQVEGQMKLGYNLLSLPSCVLSMGGIGDPPCTQKAKWYAPEEAFEIALSSDPSISRMMCQSSGGGGGGGSVEPMPPELQPPTYPAPQDVTCSSDGTSYQTKSCPTSKPSTFCGDAPPACASQIWQVPDAKNPPAGWPCPIAK